MVEQENTSMKSYKNDSKSFRRKENVYNKFDLDEKENHNIQMN